MWYYYAPYCAAEFFGLVHSEIQSSMLAFSISKSSINFLCSIIFFLKKNFLVLIYFLGRMALLVTLFLVLVNIFNTVTTNTPKAEGLTAIEAWMLSCILFVFATLVEYACLLFSRDNFVNLDENADDHDWIPETDPCRYGM